jgi:large subunit ribosomal protein L18Ae
VSCLPQNGCIITCSPLLQCKRPATQQLHDSKISFPMTRKMLRPSSRKFRTTFKAVRPNVALY